MTLQIPPDFGQAAFLMKADDSSGDVVCTLGIGVPIVPTLDSIVLSLGDAWRDNIMPRLGNNILFRGVHLSVNRGGEMFAVEDVRAGAGVGGSISGPHFPDNVAVLVRKVTTRAGREFRGRMYLPGIAIALAATSNNTLDVSDQAQFQVNLDFFFTTLNTQGTNPVLLHNSDTAPTPITAFAVQARLATQRTRMRD